MLFMNAMMTPTVTFVFALATLWMIFMTTIEILIVTLKFLLAALWILFINIMGISTVAFGCQLPILWMLFISTIEISVTNPQPATSSQHPTYNQGAATNKHKAAASNKNLVVPSRPKYHVLLADRMVKTISCTMYGFSWCNSCWAATSHNNCPNIIKNNSMRIVILQVAASHSHLEKMAILQWRGCKNEKWQRHRGRGAKTVSATEGGDAIFDILNTSRKLSAFHVWSQSHMALQYCSQMVWQRWSMHRQSFKMKTCVVAKLEALINS